MYGNFLSSEDCPKKNVHEKHKGINIDKISISDSESEGIVKLEYSDLIKKEA